MNTQPQRSGVVKLRRRPPGHLRVVSRPTAFVAPRRQGVLIQLDERRTSAARPMEPLNPMWLIVTVAAMLLSVLVSRFLR